MKKFKSIPTQFNRLRALAIVAVVLTLILAVMLILEGCSVDLTSQITQNVVDKVEEVFDVTKIDENLAPEKIDVYCSTVWYDTPTKLNIKTYPANANPSFTYEIIDYSNSDSSIIIEDGYIKNTNLDLRGYYSIKFTSTLNSNATCTYSVNFKSLNPADPRVERIEPFITEKYDSDVETSDEYFKVGKLYYVYGKAIIKEEYRQDFDGRDTIHIGNDATKKRTIAGESANMSWGFCNDNIFWKDLALCFYQPCTIDATMFFPTNNGHISTTFTMTSEIDPDNDYVPTKLTPTSESVSLSFDEESGEYVLTFSPTDKSASVFARSETGKNHMTIVDYYDEYSKECVTIETNSIRRKRLHGECYVLLRSAANRDLSVRIKVVFESGIQQGNMSIVMSGPAARGSKTQLTYSLTDNRCYTGPLHWSIIEGADKATIAQDGTLSCSGLGKITVRVESAEDPSIYADLEITIKLYNSTTLFVRKILGHIGVYMILTIGFAGSYLLLIKPRWVSLIATPVSVFAIGTLCEYIQSLHPGRSPSWYDVLYEMIGCVDRKSVV